MSGWRAHRNLRQLRVEAVKWLHSIGVAWLVAWLAFGLPQLAIAAPVGEQVINGSVNFERAGALTTITASDGAIIEYDGFDILGHETVEFIQPNAQSSVLNRIYGSPTQIMGTLRANGRVYLLNSAGIYFGGTAIVDVGALYAVAGSMANVDFLNQVDRFTHLMGDVENWGEIRGDVVSLIGRFVENHGLIVADSGLVAMVAGDEVAIGTVGGNIVVKVDSQLGEAGPSVPGVENSGVIDADGGRVILAAGDLYSLAVRHPGLTRAKRITLEGGEGGRVEVSGTLDASNLEAGQTGGSVHVLGDEVVLEGATIDASGEAGGGEILIGGDYLGAGEVRNASRTYVGPEAVLRARATGDGDGGKVIVWSDTDTRFYGSIDARGGQRGGNGGFVETSSKYMLNVVGAYVDASAALGNAGTWLLDPRNVRIEAAASALGSFDDADPNTYTPQSIVDAADSVASRDAIQTSLNKGTDVVITTQSAPDIDTQSGNITVVDSILKSRGGQATLTLDAVGDIAVNNTITSTTGALNVNLQAGGNVGVTSTVTTNGGTFSSSGVDFDSTGGVINTGTGGDANILHSGAVTLGASNIGGDLVVAAGTGDIDINNGDLVTVVGSAGFTTLGAGADINLGGTGFGDLAVTGTIAVTTTGSGGDATIVNATGVDFATSSIGNDLSVTATTGNITDSGALSVDGTSSFTTVAGGADINLDLVTLTGAVDLTTATGGDATIVNTGAATLAASNIGGDLSVTASTGNLTVSDQLVTGGTTGIDLTATTGNIALGDVDGLLTANGGGAVSLRADSGAITVAAASSSNAEIVATDVDLRARAIGATNPLDLRGATALSITDTGAGTIQVREVGSHTLSDTTLAVTAADAGTLGVEYFNNAGSLSALTSGTTTTLSSGGSGVMSNLTLTAAGAINFAAAHVTGFLDATATTGNITDSGALGVDGTSSFTTVASGADIDLDLVTLTGAVDLTTATGGDATIVNTGAVTLAASNIGGDLSVTAAKGDVTVSDQLVAGGTTGIDVTATTGNIALGDVDGLLTANGGGAVSLRADSGAITVAAASSSNAEIVATDVDLRARAIGATNPLDVRGATALSITDTGAGTIQVREVGFHTLSDTTLAVTAADAGTLGVEYFNDAGSLSALTSGGTTTLSSAGSGVMSNLTLTTAGAINFAATHVTGFLDATATTGNITDSFALSVVGTSSFTTVASGADIDLDLVTLTGAVDLTTAAGGDVSLESASDIKVNDIVTSGDVTLTSTSGNDVTIQNAIGDGANPINTLTVTANQISMGDVTSNGLQTYRGKVVLTQDAALEASPGSGDAVIFTDTVDGPASLAIIADGNVQFDADIGATTRLDSFAVQVAAASNGLVRFAKPVGGTQVLLAENDIWLNSNGRTPSTVSNHGTLVRSVDGHLTIDSENGDVTMGQGERLSVPGNLILNAGPVSGTATLADLTALQIGVSAFDVTLLLRAPSPVELVDTSIVQDSGVDVVANRISIDVLNPNDTMTLDGTGTATFGVEHQPGTGHNELTLPANFSSTSSQGSVQLTAIKRDSTPITTGEILRSSDNLVLDGIPLGANRQVLFVSGLIPVLPEPPEPPEVGPAPPKKEEVMAWMQCAQLEEGDEIPEICAEGAGGAGDFDSETFQDSSALGVLQLYRALVRSSATIERIRPAFQAAIHSYREQANSGQVLGKVFRKFLGESAGHEEAGGYLEQFEFLFGQLKMLNLLPNDYAATRDELLIEVLQELELTGLATVEGLGAIFIPSDIPDVEAPTA